jgi:hypothetical protein
MWASTGLPANFVHERPRSVLQAIACENGFFAAV